MIQRAVDAAAARCADHERHTEVSVGAIPDPRRLAHDLIERRVDEVGELDLSDGEQAVQSHPDRDADDARLREGGVEDASFAELVQPAHTDPKHAAACSDVLAQEHDPVVLGHLVVQRVPDRSDDVLLRHVAS